MEPCNLAFRNNFCFLFLFGIFFTFRPCSDHLDYERSRAIFFFSESLSLFKEFKVRMHRNLKMCISCFYLSFLLDVARDIIHWKEIIMDGKSKSAVVTLFRPEHNLERKFPSLRPLVLPHSFVIEKATTSHWLMQETLSNRRRSLWTVKVKVLWRHFSDMESWFSIFVSCPPHILV